VVVVTLIGVNHRQVSSFRHCLDGAIQRCTDQLSNAGCIGFQREPNALMPEAMQRS